MGILPYNPAPPLPGNVLSLKSKRLKVVIERDMLNNKMYVLTLEFKTRSKVRSAFFLNGKISRNHQSRAGSKQFRAQFRADNQKHPRINMVCKQYPSF